MFYSPICKTVEDAYREIDKLIPGGQIKKTIDITGKVLRISLLKKQNVPTVKIITRRIVSQFIFLRKTKLFETILEFYGGWKQHYPDDKEILSLEPAWNMTGILYNK